MSAITPPVPALGRARTLAGLLRGEVPDLPLCVTPFLPYAYHLLILVVIPLALFLDVHTANVWQQDVLGLCSFSILFFCTRFSTPSERTQVWCMVAIATCVEIWSSVIWGVYRYRFDNMPLFVPWGHGMVYLFALRAGRTPFMHRHGTLVARVALLLATCWMLYGVAVEPLLWGRLDILGALFWPIFVWFMRKPAAPIFAAAFFVTAYLEIVGTSFGNWTWQVYAPVSHIPSGNPPSVISAGYCLMDFMSIQAAAWLPNSPLARLRLFRIRSA